MIVVTIYPDDEDLYSLVDVRNLITSDDYCEVFVGSVVTDLRLRCPGASDKANYLNDKLFNKAIEDNRGSKNLLTLMAWRTSSATKVPKGRGQKTWQGSHIDLATNHVEEEIGYLP
jgi:hypothetical protein